MEKTENLNITEIIDPIDNIDVITDLVFEGKKDVTIKDIGYMCNYLNNYEDCSNCPLNGGRICGYAFLLKKFQTHEQINNAVLTWLQENPPTSYLMDIKEKMPNVELVHNIPNFCVQSIYGKDCCICNMGDNSKFESSNINCRKCWRTPIDENIKKEYENP